MAGTLSVEARHAVQDLLIDLNWALDTGDVERFAGVFSPDADFVVESDDDRHRIEGRDGMVADFRARLASSAGGSQHRVTNSLFVPGADGSCTMWSYWSTSVRSPQTGEVDLAASGWICDRLEEEAGNWAIRHHHVTIWRDGMTHPLSGAACC